MNSTMMTLSMSLLLEILYTFVVYRYFNIFFERKKLQGSFCFILVINILIQNIESHILYYPAYCRLISTVLTLFICASLCYVGGLGERMIFSLIFVAVSMLGEALVACMISALNMSAQDNEQLGFLITYLMLLFLIEILYHLFNDWVVVKMSWTTYLKIMLLPIGSMFLAYRIFYTQYQMGIRGLYWKTIISIMILLFLNIIMFNIFVRLSENMELQRKTAIYEKEFDLLERHMHEKEVLNQEFRVKRHDMKHQMLNLLALLHSGEYGKLEEDIKQLAELESFNDLFIVNTENSFVDTFVNNKYTISIENGIDFKADLRIPRELPFASEDLCVILGNALDNAIEACLRGEIAEKLIRLQMVYDRNNLVIIIENTFDGKIKINKRGIRTTRKDNKQQHGLGINSIKKTIEKYNGTYYSSVKDEWYCLKIILYND